MIPNKNLMVKIQSPMSKTKRIEIHGYFSGVLPAIFGIVSRGRLYIDYRLSRVISDNPNTSMQVRPWILQWYVSALPWPLTSGLGFISLSGGQVLVNFKDLSHLIETYWMTYLHWVTLSTSPFIWNLLQRTQWPENPDYVDSLRNTRYHPHREYGQNLFRHISVNFYLLHIQDKYMYFRLRKG
jgi:hypothetical protein